MRLVFIFFLAFTILSCSENIKRTNIEVLHVGDFSWDTYKVSEMRNGMTYSATQLPVEYYLRKNVKLEDTTTVDSLVGTMKEERVIIAEFQDLSQKDVLKSDFTNRSYEEAVKYIAATIQQDYLFITSNQDTIKCNGVLFERNFNVAPFKRVLLYFDGVPPNETGTLLYKDQLFGNGNFLFKLNERPIKS